MTLLILAQPGAIIDIYQERLIVAVICLNYSGDQETRAWHHTCHLGSYYKLTASQMDYAPQSSLLYSKMEKQREAFSLAILHQHRVHQPPIWLWIGINANCVAWQAARKQTIHVGIIGVTLMWVTDHAPTCTVLFYNSYRIMYTFRGREGIPTDEGFPLQSDNNPENTTRATNRICKTDTCVKCPKSRPILIEYLWKNTHLLFTNGLHSVWL